MKLFLMFICLAACSGTSMQVRFAYSIEVARCIANEQAIIDRTGTTEEQDYADLIAERDRCDAALASIVHGGAQ